MSFKRRVAAICEIASDPSLIEDRAATLALVISRVIERLVLAAALFTSPGNLVRGLVFAVTAAALHVVRSLLAVRLQISCRVLLQKRAAAAVLAAHPMVPLGGADLDVFATVLEGTELFTRLLVNSIPDAAGDTLAILLLLVFVVRRLPFEHFAFFAVLVVVAGVAAVLARRVTSSQARLAWNANRPVWQQLHAALGARDEIVASGASKATLQVLAARLGRWTIAERKYRTLAGLSGRLPFVAVVAGLALGVLSQWNGGLDADLLREGFLLAGVSAPLASLVASLQAAARSEPAIARLIQLMDHPRTKADSPFTSVSFSLPHEVALHDISYRYVDADRPAIAGASFVWRRGRVLGVGGQNGSGKSTMLRLLLRLDMPTSGTALVDGREWTSIDDHAWRTNVAYVAQTPYLHEEMTVGEVCRLLASDADDATLERALRRVGLWERLLRERRHDPLAVPLRLLSAGMRQRVVLARALAQDRSILLLDEPDASLDAEGVAQLASLLRELSPDRLIAVVAHSSALLNAADDSVVLAAVPPAEPSGATSRTLTA